MTVLLAIPLPSRLPHTGISRGEASLRKERISMYKAVKNDAGKRPERLSRPRRVPRRVPGRGTAGRIVSAVVLLAAAGALVAAPSFISTASGNRQLEVPLAAVPAGSSVSVCPGPARLLEGTPVGTDPQFSPESATAATTP